MCTMTGQSYSVSWYASHPRRMTIFLYDSYTIWGFTTHFSACLGLVLVCVLSSVVVVSMVVDPPVPFLAGICNVWLFSYWLCTRKFTQVTQWLAALKYFTLPCKFGLIRPFMGRMAVWRGSQVQLALKGSLCQSKEKSDVKDGIGIVLDWTLPGTG